MVSLPTLRVKPSKITGWGALPLRRLGQSSHQLQDGPALIAESSAYYPDPGPLTVTVGDTGWLTNRRITPIRASVRVVR
jgi:hypothetical protein